MKILSAWCVVLALTCGAALGQTYKVLWSFGSSPSDGASSVSNLIFDKAGNLYGTTQFGGSATNLQCGNGGGCGTVFELSPNADGTWTNNIIYNFCANYSGSCLDGQQPTAGLAMDAAGNLYGTTYFGGPGCGNASAGCGTVFELSPPQSSGDPWTETVLYLFRSLNNCLDGVFPNSHLTFDGSGNLYGTTTGGGAGAWYGGTVFELSPNAGPWIETVLYNFCVGGRFHHCPDGTYPQAAVTFDHTGNLYGTTETGGTPSGGGGGTLFALTPTANGWSESTLYAFNPASGIGGLFGVVSLDSVGDLYSTSCGGGQSHGGTVFRFNPKGKTMRAASLASGGGACPTAGIVIDETAGAGYGTASSGFTKDSGGTVFKFGSSGEETVLYTFCQLQNCADGYAPQASLILHDGNLYGTTEKGGALGYGVVFEITP